MNVENGIQPESHWPDFDAMGEAETAALAAAFHGAAPFFGRTVIMEQSANAAHGQPEPVRQGRCRRSAVAYFYTNGLTADGASDVLETVYIPHDGYSRRQHAELLLRRMTPPAVIKGLKAVRSVFN